MKPTRRFFIKALSLLPFVRFDSFAGDDKTKRSEISIRHSKFDPWIEIKKDHLIHNVQQIRNTVDERPIMAVIKNNGYGIGLLNAAQSIEHLDAIEGFAVVKLSEAITLREYGIKKPVLLMGSFTNEELEEAVRMDITPMVYTPVGDVLERISNKLQKTIPVEMCVDTGLGRVGVPHHQAESLYRDLGGRNGIIIQGSMMTFTEDKEFDKEQIRRFVELSDTLKRHRLPVGRMHAASTTPIFWHPESYFDMVRPGMAIYGIYPKPEQRDLNMMDLRPALSLKCRVIYVKKLRKGDTAGYGRAFEADGDVYIATIPIGHADGWQRSSAGCAKVRINDKLYPVVASVSASHSIVKIGPEEEVKTGDIVTVFDWQDGSRPDDINKACGTSTYDLTMHLSALLPRWFVE